VPRQTSSHQRRPNPGSVGDSHYSPLVRVTNRNGIVFNAPIVAFNVGAEKISFCNGDPDYTVMTDYVAKIGAGYSPKWDVRLAVWTKDAIAKGQRTIIKDGDDLEEKSASGLLVSPAGGPVRTRGNLVNAQWSVSPMNRRAALFPRMKRTSLWNLGTLSVIALNSAGAAYAVVSCI
jgi:hypothetical protein